MIKRMLLAGAVSFCTLTSGALAQGVPTIDGTQLGQLLAQLEHMANDLTVQLDQVATMRQELETQISQLTNLDAQLLSLIEGNGLGQLLATVDDFERLKGVIEQPIASLDQIKAGNSPARFGKAQPPPAVLGVYLEMQGFPVNDWHPSQAHPSPAITIWQRKLERAPCCPWLPKSHMSKQGKACSASKQWLVTLTIKTALNQPSISTPG